MTAPDLTPGDLPHSPRVPFTEALGFWIWLGFVNFGGPTGQIALMHTELVERRRWIGEASFLHALNFAMLLPGPEAHQLAIYVGWLLNGTPGALAAGVFFLLPAFGLMVALSWIYAVHGDVTWISGIFDGLAWAVVGIVSAALLRIGARALGHAILVALAAAAFLALFLFGVPFPLVVLGAGVVGLVVGASLPGSRAGATDLRQAERVAPSWGRTARVLAIGLAVWLVPLAAIALAAGSGSVLADEALFFAGAALVTFGGAYAVLAYVNQAAVIRFGWLSASEMAVGLSLAETTPGPLIMVVVFVGFLASYREPGSVAPVLAGIAGALVVAWATFVPSFLWIFLGRPLGRTPPRQRAALRGAHRDHGGRRRRDREPGRRVRDERAVRRDRRPDTVRTRGRGPGAGLGRPARDRRRDRVVRRDPPLPRERRLGDPRRGAGRSRSCRGRVTVRPSACPGSCHVPGQRVGYARAMTDRESLERLSAQDLHDRATRLAWRRLDVSFLWNLLSTIPEARAAGGDQDRSEMDILRPLALLNDLVDADRGELAEALRPLYVDYLVEHEMAEMPTSPGGRGSRGSR